MHIRTFHGYSAETMDEAIGQAEEQAQALLKNLSTHELRQITAQTIANATEISYAFYHIITIVYA